MKITGITVQFSGIALFHRALYAAVVGFVTTAAWWLITGSTPDLLELLVAGLVLDCVASALLYARRAAEARTLREMYENPSAEETK